MEALIHTRWGVKGGLILTEDVEAFEALIDGGTPPEAVDFEASERGFVVVGLKSDDTYFVGYDAPSLDVFFRNAHLMILEQDRLIRVDPRPLYDLLRERLPAVRDQVPPIPYKKWLKRYQPGFLGFRSAKSELLDSAERALEQGADFCGMLSVCERDHLPECYSTYAWLEDGVCLVMVTYDCDMVFELFPFRITGAKAFLRQCPLLTGSYLIVCDRYALTLTSILPVQAHNGVCRSP